MVEHDDTDEVAGQAKPGIPGGHVLPGVAECEAARPEQAKTTAPQSRAWPLAPLSSGGRRGCLWPEDQRQP